LSALREVGGDLPDALEEIGVPSYVIDPDGIIRWVNPAGVALVGDVRGRRFTSVVAPKDARRARDIFAKKIIGTERSSDTKGALIGADGQPVQCEISAVALLDGHRVVGVFGQVADIEDHPDEPPQLPVLTPRQTEVLHLLERGYSTEQIATRLTLSPATVRNHIRHLFRALGVHSRLEAVACARRARNSGY
jgi:PAS domain S-box-containing protein